MGDIFAAVQALVLSGLGLVALVILRHVLRERLRRARGLV